MLVTLGAFAGRFLRVSDPLTPADAIVVLGGEGGSHNRAARGVELYFAGLAPRVVFSGGCPNVCNGTVQSSMERSRTAGLRMGLPPRAARAAPEAHNTYEEARNLRMMAAKHGWRTLIVVTDDYHSRRAARAFRTLNPDLTIILSPAPVPGYDPGHWWANRGSARYVGSELLKLAFYWLRYGITPV